MFGGIAAGAISGNRATSIENLLGQARGVSLFVRSPIGFLRGPKGHYTCLETLCKPLPPS